MAIVMLALSLTICEILAKVIKCQKFDLENGQDQGVEERDLPCLTENVWFPVGDFFRILAAWEHMFTQTGYAQGERRG